MTTYERSVQIIAEQIEKHRTDSPEQLARRCLEAMRKKRIVPHTLKASEEMFTRFHAHCRHVGNMTGRGYSHYYSEAIKAAMATDDWPIKVVNVPVDMPDGQTIEVDVPVPESTTRATNGQLMAAYQVIVDEARREGITLPEHP